MCFAYLQVSRAILDAPGLHLPVEKGMSFYTTCVVSAGLVWASQMP